MYSRSRSPSEMGNRGRAFPLRTESGDLPSLSVRLKFTGISEVCVLASGGLALDGSSEISNGRHRSFKESCLWFHRIVARVNFFLILAYRR
ncbi:hypothetical protein F2Q70_00024038 [Brassica cretica]|uniref:Uncharacterized protein n=1 Tax=Brassica cretica TaxID=69181 RepID=A0A8S9GLF6_BRACR|nr:hypothetical protein F2Q70_00024038 [Brassica cretica]